LRGRFPVLKNGRFRGYDFINRSHGKLAKPKEIRANSIDAHVFP